MQSAQRVVKAVSDISPFPISLSDETGYIIGDSNPSRIGTLHSPSILVIRENRFLSFDKNKVSQMDNVLPGVAVPLIYDYETVGVLGIIGDPEKVKPYANLVKRYVELMWQETFHQKMEDLERSSNETFLQYILLNESLNKEKIIKYCEMLGINYFLKRFCVVIDIGDSLLNNRNVIQKLLPADHLKKLLLECTSRVFESTDESICTFLNTEKIVLLMPVESDNKFLELMKKFSDQSSQLMKLVEQYHVYGVAIGAGNPYSTLKHINQSYHEAEQVIEFGKEHNLSPPIYNYCDWDVLSPLLSAKMDENLKDKLLFRLKPFIGSFGFSELANDFMMYCKNNMNSSKTAKELYIHRNTMIYRLKKIETITSLDLGNFEHCTMLYLILKNYVDVKK
ncbi:sugar diacid recognition domain-containing protein [Virgibacillus sp. C22-A2]|uniref:Sugar diacid recognition domain-containing protein n=1 Tax=Virgibacillus tibetensis TaxID=3042313 RepID=A0ABU6KM62_9BACI|nr:sugar diacid recognition domain-containing protein [Virgibacillus sp. C22-A2]